MVMSYQNASTGDWIEREELTPRILGSYPFLQKAFDMWKDGTLVYMPELTTVDVSSESPGDYGFKHFGGPYPGADEALSGKPVRAFPSQTLAYNALADYHEVKEFNIFKIFLSDHHIDGFRRYALRMLLPLKNKRGKVTEVGIVGVHLQQPIVSPDVFMPASSSSCRMPSTSS